MSPAASSRRMDEETLASFPRLGTMPPRYNMAALGSNNNGAGLDETRAATAFIRNKLKPTAEKITEYRIPPDLFATCYAKFQAYEDEHSNDRAQHPSTYDSSLHQSLVEKLSSALTGIIQGTGMIEFDKFKFIIECVRTAYCEQLGLNEDFAPNPTADPKPFDPNVLQQTVIKWLNISDKFSQPFIS